MGFYIRKSISVGPLRFNMSGGGVGVSVGVRGLRVGTGPHGNYVHMGRHGFYYRQTLAPARHNDPMPRFTPRSPESLGINTTPVGTHAPLQEIQSVDATQIHDSSSDALLAEIRAKRRRISLFPIAVILLAAFVLLALAYELPIWLIFAIGVIGLTAILLAHQHDKLEKTVVVFYDFEPEIEQAFKTFCEWAGTLSSVHRIWHIDAAGRVYNRKYHAGASQLVRRSPTTIKEASPPFVKSNVPVYSITVGPNKLYWFPDRLLVYNGRAIGAVSYRSLEIEASAKRFIEEQGLPSDATVVDYTWRFVNKNGGPDRRFNNNTQLPICKYGELSLKTLSGLNELLQLSRSGVGEGFAAAVKHMASITPA